jgi:hypothetical protein
MKKLLFGLLLSMSISVFAQDKTTLSGYVKDAETGEALIGATVYLPDAGKGAYTNEYGFYSLTLTAGTYQVNYQYLGYQTHKEEIDLAKSIRKDIELALEGNSLDEVIISGQSADNNVQAAEMGVTRLSISEIKKVPVLFGETDVLKTMQLLPGVKPAGEGNSGFFVRGGGSDQNLILLDEAPVYNPSHLLGFFSVFNGDAINSTKLYKGNMPAEYGGRLSSALDIQMKDGNKKDYSLSGGIGLISSRLTAEGPLVEDKGSFMVSGRRTYADAFLLFSSDTTLNSSTLYFYDLNAKANYKLGEKDHIYLSGYFGRDKFGIGNDFNMDWGNATGTLRWNHLFNDKLFLNSSLIYSDYDYEIELGAAGASVSSGIQDWNLKEDFSYYANSQHTLKFGANAIYHTFLPGEVKATIEGESGIDGKKIEERYALETAAYISHEWKPSQQFSVNYGLRYSNFTVLGPGTFYDYDAKGNTIDSATYAQNEVVTNYGGFEPRITASYVITPEQSIKASYARNRQYIHLLSNSTASTPTDVWIPSSNNVQPEIADQVSLGYFRNFDDNKWESSVEVYYKDMQNQIEYKNGADLFLNDYVESQLVYGTGYSYGAEFLLRKKTGKFTGWLGYTWSKTMREFDEINDGNPFPARQDRTHDISIVGMYDLNKKWDFSASWVYYTGDAVTFPSGSYVVDGNLVPLYTERNGYRLPDYHRLDLSATYFGKNPDSNLNISLYNAYGRKNVYSIDFQPSETNPGTQEAVKTYLFQWVPSVTYNFKF